MPVTRRFFTTSAAAAALVLGTAPGMAQAAGKVIVVATIGEPPTLDPVGVTADLVSIISQHVFETLYTFDSEWKVVPFSPRDRP